MENIPETCLTCGRSRDKLDKINWERHVTACKEKTLIKGQKKKQKKRIKEQNEDRKRKNRYSSSTVTKFFKRTSDKNSELCASVTSTLADIETSPTAINDSDIDKTVHLTTPTEVSLFDLLREICYLKLNLKCGGFNTGFDNVYIKLACHQLSALDIVIEDNKLHNSTCKESGYRVCDGNYVNKLCSDLQSSQKLKKILERGRKSYAEKELLVTNSTYLSHNQLCERAHMLQEEKRRLRLQVMNTIF